MYGTLNIVGGEWVIIVFVALVLILGTNKLPEAAKKLGRAVNEYNRARDGIGDSMRDFSGHDMRVDGPVQTERQKLEAISRSLGMDPAGRTTDELREMISSRIGKRAEPD